MATGRHSYVRFFPSDWLGGTARMTRMHRSVYFDVCCYIWDTAEPCPATELPLMLGDIPNWRDLVEDLVVARKLRRLDDGSLVNPKAMEEAELAFELWSKKSKGGKNGADKTNQKRAAGSPDGTPDSTPDGTGDGSKPKTSGTPVAEPEPEPEPEPYIGDGGRAHAREEIPDIDWTDSAAAAAELCRAGGIRHIDPKRIIDHVSLVNEWAAEGISAETALEAIRDVVATSAEPIHSLKYFAPAVRRHHAVKENPDAGLARNRQRSAEPADPLVAAAARREAQFAAGGDPEF